MRREQRLPSCSRDIITAANGTFPGSRRRPFLLSMLDVSTTWTLRSLAPSCSCLRELAPTLSRSAALVRRRFCWSVHRANVDWRIQSATTIGQGTLRNRPHMACAGLRRGTRTGDKELQRAHGEGKLTTSLPRRTSPNHARTASYDLNLAEPESNSPGGDPAGRVYSERISPN